MMENQHEHSPSALPANAFIPRGFQLQCHQDIHKLFYEVSQGTVFLQSLVCRCVCWYFCVLSCCDIWAEEATFLPYSTAKCETFPAFLIHIPPSPFSLFSRHEIAKPDQYVPNYLFRSWWRLKGKPGENTTSHIFKQNLLDDGMIRRNSSLNGGCEAERSSFPPFNHFLILYIEVTRFHSLWWGNFHTPTHPHPLNCSWKWFLMSSNSFNFLIGL